MNKEDLEVVAFEIILYSGNARKMIHDSFTFMRQSKFDKADNLFEEANAELVKAHQSQTELLKRYASGESVNMEIIMVHAQDHLMTTMTLLEVAQEMEFLYKK